MLVKMEQSFPSNNARALHAEEVSRAVTIPGDPNQLASKLLKEIQDLINTIRKEQRRPQQHELQHLLTLATQLIIDALHENNFGMYKKEESAFLQDFFQVLNLHLGDSDFSITQLCRKLAVSRAQLNRKIRELTSLSVMEHLRKMRIERAHHLLLTTSSSISEIANTCGFDDPNYFCRAFTKAYGCSPTIIRKQGINF